MNDSTDGKLNTTLVRDYCCAQCFGPLVEKFIDGRYTVVCALDEPCSPGGFRTIKGAESQISAELSEAFEVADNYPELSAPPPAIPPEKRRAMKAQLFGEE